MTPVAAILRAGLIGAAVLLIGGIGIGAIAVAETSSAVGLQIGNPWTRATPKGSTVTAGYLTITNNGTEVDRLIGGSAAPAVKALNNEAITGAVKKRKGA